MMEIIEQKGKQQDGEGERKKYNKGQLIGRGGFAKCYRGIDLSSKEEVAIKVVEKTTLARSRAKQKLISEIKIHRSLTHPYIVKFLNVFEDEKNVYIILQLCPHGTLSDILKKRRKLTPTETRFYMRQLLIGLQYLHKNKVIHRDLKMGNIFIAHNMNIKLGDFGLSAKLEFFEERKRTMAGTPNYIAPEILEGGSGHSYEVDLWSTGVICYALLFGRPPFETNEVKLTYSRIKNCEYKFPVPQESKDFIRGVLVLDPKKRMTISEMLSHPFLKMYIPQSLPIQALDTIPNFNKDLQLHASHSQQKLRLTYSPTAMKQFSRKYSMKTDAGDVPFFFQKGIERKQFPHKEPQHNFEVFVEIFADYSTKYGLGYCLNSGECGVYFNDSSLLTLDKSCQSYLYILNPGGEAEMIKFPWNKIPQNDKSLSKKIMLLQKFEVHLKEGRKNIENIRHEMNRSEQKLIFIRQWLKTKHAIMFRLSNQIFQVDFFDKSQILLCTDNKNIFFTNKNGEKIRTTLNEALQQKQTQMGRRIKYTRQILNSLKKNKNQSQ